MKHFKYYSWYALGVFLPILVSVIKTPVFTRYFTPEEYGYLSLVLITYSYVSVLTFYWISSNIWRYYHQAKRSETKFELYNTILFFFLVAVLITIIVGFIYSFVVPPAMKPLVWWGMVYFSLKELVGFYNILSKLEQRKKIFNLIQVYQSVLSFVLLILLTFGFSLRIEAVFISFILADISLLIVVAFYYQRVWKHFRFRPNKEYSKQFWNFGKFGVFFALFLIVVESSDRYLVAVLDSVASAGIYHQAYTICQVSIGALIVLFYNMADPVLIKAQESDYEQAASRFSQSAFTILSFGLPIAFFLSFYAQSIAQILLGEKFQMGYIVMPYVFTGIFIYALVNLFELRLKFSRNISKIVWVYAFALLINVAVNFIFIPRYGFVVAGISTFMAYVFMLLGLFYFEPGFIRFSTEKKRFILKSVGWLFFFGLFSFFLRRKMDYTLWMNITEGIFFALLYFLISRKGLLSTFRAFMNMVDKG